MKRTMIFQRGLGLKRTPRLWSHTLVNSIMAGALPVARVGSRTARTSFVQPSPTPLALVALLSILALAPAQAQVTDVTWNRQAFGQTFQCPPPRDGVSYGWPNNSNWSQSETFGDVCSIGVSLRTGPSNWSTPNYPNGLNYNAILGRQGGSFANLDVRVTLNGLTILSDGGLNMQFGTSITAHAFDFQGDGGILVGGGGGAWPGLTLAGGGTMTKSGGAGIFALDPGIQLSSTDGTIAVNSGTLELPGNGSRLRDVTLNVAAEATLNLVPQNQEVRFAGRLTGEGEGTVLWNRGRLIGESATFDLPYPLFQWTGGQMEGTLTNANAMTISGSGGVGLAGVLSNAGFILHTDSASLGINWGQRFQNLEWGVYYLYGDGSIVIGGGGGAWPQFENAGLLIKGGGTGNSRVDVPFVNRPGGSIEVDSGQLSLARGDYVQGGGALTIALGGRGAGEFGQLIVAERASLDGPLNVFLMGDFVPEIGDQFQILSSVGLSGTFSELNVPPGISVEYRGNGVFLVVADAAPAQVR